MDKHDLKAYIDEWSRTGRNIGATFPDQEISDNGTSKAQRNIAVWIRRAMIHRAAGRIETALQCEAQVDKLYAKLPKNLRW